MVTHNYKNLLEETIQVLELHGKTIKDVEFVIGFDKKSVGKLFDLDVNSNYIDNVRSTWDEFAKQANRFYDAGYGGVEVMMDVQIVGKDFYLERNQYDGSERWEYREIPKAEDYQEGQIIIFEEDIFEEDDN